MFERIESAITNDKKFGTTLCSLISVFLIFANQLTVRSPILGLTSTAIYSLVNITFLGNAFFKQKTSYVRLGLGSLLLIMLLGLVGWPTLIIYNLDFIRSTVVFFAVAALSSMANRLSRYTFSIEFVRDISKA